MAFAHSKALSDLMILTVPPNWVLAIVTKALIKDKASSLVTMRYVQVALEWSSTMVKKYLLARCLCVVGTLGIHMNGFKI